MSQSDVMQREGECGSVRQVRDDHGVGPTSGFVQKDQVGDFLGQARLDERSDDGVSSIEAVGIREDQAEFLCVSVGAWAVRLEIRANGREVGESKSRRVGTVDSNLPW